MTVDRTDQTMSLHVTLTKKIGGKYLGHSRNTYFMKRDLQQRDFLRKLS